MTPRWSTAAVAAADVPVVVVVVVVVDAGVVKSVDQVDTAVVVAAVVWTIWRNRSSSSRQQSPLESRGKASG